MSDQPANTAPPANPEISVARFAQKFQLQAAACLVQIIRDESATASSRATAATKLLEYAAGRPGASRPIMVEDLATMSDSQRMDLLKALVGFYAPTTLTDMVAAAVSAALAEQEAKCVNAG